MPSSIAIVTVAAPPTSETSPDEPPPPVRPGRLRTVLRGVLGTLLGVWALLLALWLILHWGILNHIEYWRPEIERRAGAALGVSVQIGRIEVQSGRWIPAMTLHEVTLRDADGRTALRLPRVFAALSPRSLLALRPQLTQLLVHGADLEVRRAADGRWSVAGLPVPTGPMAADAGGDRRGLDWILSQRELVLLDGTVRWVDERSTPGELVLRDVRAVLRNGTTRRHAWRLDVTPPPDIGRPITVQGRFRRPLLSSPSDLERWSGSAYLEAPLLDLGALAPRLSLPITLSSARGAVRSWFDVVDGAWRTATMDLAVQHLDLRLAPDLEPLRLADFGGRLAVDRPDGETRVRASRVVVGVDDAHRWTEGGAELTWRPARDAAAQGGIGSGTLATDALDLGLVGHVARRLPLPAAARHWLDTLEPRGRLETLRLGWDGPPASPSAFRLDARVAGLELAPADPPEPGRVGRPGIRGLNLTIGATEAGGRAMLGMQGGELVLPGILPDVALPLTELAGEVRWQHRTAASTPSSGAVPPGASGPASGAPPVARAPEAAGSGAAATAPSAIAPSAASATRAATSSTSPAVPAGFEVSARGLRFATPDLRGQLDAVWRPSAVEPGDVRAEGGSPAPGELQLDARIQSLPAARLVHYLPLQLGAPVLDYLDRSIVDGRLRDVRVLVRGDLRRFPFADPDEGLFRVSGRVENARFDYLPSPERAGATATANARAGDAWPGLQMLGGLLEVERRSLRFRDAVARLQGVELRGVHGSIEPMGKDAVLTLKGAAEGRAADMLEFVRRTPIGGWLGGALDQAQASGTAGLTLGLTIPLARAQDGRVDGRLRLGGNDLRIGPDHPPMRDANGEIAFGDREFRLVDTTAEMFGGPARVAGGSRPEGGFAFAVQGRASAAGLRQSPELGPVARWATQMEGTADYAATMTIAGGRRELQVRSELVGMTAALPAPLDKRADAVWPLQVSMRREPAGAGRGAEVETIEVGLADRLQSLYRRELSVPGRPGRVLQGGIGLRAPLRVPPRGVAAAVGGDRFDIDAWRRVLDRLEAAGASAAGTAAPSASAENDFLPRDVGLRTRELILFGQRFSDVEATTRFDGRQWISQVQADQLAGRIDYLPPGVDASADSGLVRARLQRMSMPDGDAGGPAAAAAASVPAAASTADPTTRPAAVHGDVAPSRMPALDIEVTRLQRRGRELGRLEVRAVQRTGPPIDWQLERLRLENDDGTVEATGHWRERAGAPAGARRMSLDFRIDSRDSGAMLQRFGIDRALAGGAGAVTGTLGWLGSPYRPDLPTLDGRLQIELGKGRFLKAEPGVGRLLGVLSLQSLPRRLLLDFSDVIGEGFAFDEVRAGFDVSGGIARTKDFRMRGVPAIVLLEGEVDLARETQDLQAVVVPEFSAGAASLLWAAVNPVAGLGAFVAQWLLSKQMSVAGTREFHVHGSWGEPQVDRVERTRADAQGPASGASASGAAVPAGAASRAAPAAPRAADPASTVQPSGAASVPAR